MLTFLVCLTALVIAYFTYGRYLERVAAIDPARSVPSETLFDGVDYVPMPPSVIHRKATGPNAAPRIAPKIGPVPAMLSNWIRKTRQRGMGT